MAPTPPDFFPLVKGAVREYSSGTALGKGAFKIEILSVATSGAKTIAKCRRTVRGNGEPPAVAEFEAIKDAAEVRSGSATEFKLPVRKGVEWIVSPRRYWIEALDASIKTPAGSFTNCLRVAYLIAEGDGSSGERYYAPGVGLVKVVENDEGEPFTHELIAHSG